MTSGPVTGACARTPPSLKAPAASAAATTAGSSD